MEGTKAVFAAVTFACASLVAPAQGAEIHADHVFVTPKDLKWVDVPSLPKGAKAAKPKAKAEKAAKPPKSKSESAKAAPKTKGRATKKREG